MLARANPRDDDCGRFAGMIMLLFGTCLITQRPARFGFRVRRSRTNLSRSFLPLNEGPAIIETAGSPQVGIKWPPREAHPVEKAPFCQCWRMGVAAGS